MEVLSGCRAFISLSLLLMFSLATSVAQDGPTTPNSVKTTCMGELGCFPVTPDFVHPLYRPVNLLPDRRESINTTFYLYSQADPRTGYVVRAKDKGLLGRSGFDALKKTKVIVHGFMHKVFEEWMLKLKDEYLLNGDHNVVVVDWSGGDKFPYTQATANTRVVAAEIVLLLNWLKDSEGLKADDVHILGHSLGSHIAGYVGQRVSNLKRITGMDPAQPYFQGLPASVRLDPTDAQFVDVIHTDARPVITGGVGLIDPIGHVDFYPNGGHTQPGCKKGLLDFFNEGIISGVKGVLGCDHHRAVDFSRDSVNRNRCIFTGYTCPSWEMFLQGRCTDCGPRGDKCAQMGERAPDHYLKLKNDTVQNKFYLQTSSKPPYCLYHYQVTVQLEDTKAADQEGTLTLTLQGDLREQKFQLANGEKMKLYHGSAFPFLVTTTNDLGDLHGASLTFEAAFSLIIWKKKEIHLKSIKVLPMNIVDQSTRAAQTRQFCVEGNLVESKKEATLKKC